LAIPQQGQSPLGAPIVAVTEKRQVKVDEVNIVRFHRFEYFKIVAKGEFIDRHKYSLPERIPL
jgi:hypothetical protein